MTLGVGARPEGPDIELFSHPSFAQHFCPFSAGTCMEVRQMLSKVIWAKKLLSLVAFPKSVHVLEMF
jgi:hypothetical protein